MSFHDDNAFVRKKINEYEKLAEEHEHRLKEASAFLEVGVALIGLSLLFSCVVLVIYEF